jgi:HK97 gp10 family phage protein
MVKSEWNIPKIEDLLRMIYRDRLELAAEYVVSEAKLRCPVDTGRLRDSINYQVEFEGNKMTASIGTNVTYGVYIELGTNKIGARPYLRPALLENIPNIKKILGAK